MTLPTMKTHILTLATIAALTTLGLADSPDAILKDYRARAAQATQRLNETLEKQASTIITELIRKGDTTGAETVTTQVKQKITGEPITPPPHVAAAALFAQYDGARATALQPIQKASLARIDSLLNVPGGAKVAELKEITKAKLEVETGKTEEQMKGKNPFPLHWTYHAAQDAEPVATMDMNLDGTWTLTIKASGKKEDGTWKRGQKPTIISLTYEGTSWDMIIDGKAATMYRPDSGRRWLKAL